MSDFKKTTRKIIDDYRIHYTANLENHACDQPEMKPYCELETVWIRVDAVKLLLDESLKEVIGQPLNRFEPLTFATLSRFQNKLLGLLDDVQCGERQKKHE